MGEDKSPAEGVQRIVRNGTYLAVLQNVSSDVRMVSAGSMGDAVIGAVSGTVEAPLGEAIRDTLRELE